MKQEFLKNFVSGVLLKVGTMIKRDFLQIEHLKQEKQPKFIEKTYENVGRVLFDELSNINKSLGFKVNGAVYKENSENYWDIEIIDSEENFIRGVGFFGLILNYVSSNDDGCVFFYDSTSDCLHYAFQKDQSYSNGRPIRFKQRNKSNLTWS
jgi:fructose-1,6-bisphosphatase/inositol monophosphatase family enzyme